MSKLNIGVINSGSEAPLLYRLFKEAIGIDSNVVLLNAHGPSDFSAFSAIAISDDASNQSLAMDALKAKKAVFICAKNSLEFAQRQQFQQVASESRTKLQIIARNRFHSAVLNIRKLILDGSFGELRYLYLERAGSDQQRIRGAPSLDDLSSILRLSGEMPTRVNSVCMTAGSPETSPVMSALSFRNQCRAHVFVNPLSPLSDHRLVISGSSKSAVIHDSGVNVSVFLYDRVLEFENERPILHTDDGLPIDLNEESALRTACEEFVTDIEGRDSGARLELNVLEIYNACLQSAQLNGVPVDVCSDSSE